MTHPNLTSELGIPDPSGIWQPKPVHQSMKDATSSDPSGYARAVTHNGQVVSTETGKAVRGSSATAHAEQNAAARMPYDYAVDPVTRTQISPHQLTEDSILFFDGRGEVTVAQARAAGFLPPGWQRPGTYPDQVLTQREENQPRPFDASQEQPKEEVHPDLQFDLLADEALDRDYSNLVDTTGALEQQQAIEQIIGNGEIDARTLGTLASQLRVEPEVLQSRVQPLMQAFEQQARAVMGEGGLDSNDVVAWAQQNCPAKLQQAMSKQATMRQASGYAEIREDYIACLGEHNPSAALNADLGNGITQYQDAKGRVMVRFPGMSEMLWETAIKSFGIRKS